MFGFGMFTLQGNKKNYLKNNKNLDLSPKYNIKEFFIHIFCTYSVQNHIIRRGYCAEKMKLKTMGNFLA